MTFRNVIHAIQLLFFPQNLKEEALREQNDIRAENIIETMNMMEEMIKAKRKSLFLELLWISTLAILGFVIAQAINLAFAVPSRVVCIVRTFSLSIFAFATLSRLGETPTFTGNTLIEKTNKFLFKILYSIGFLLTIAALSLDFK